MYKLAHLRIVKRWHFNNVRFIITKLRVSTGNICYIDEYFINLWMIKLDFSMNGINEHVTSSSIHRRGKNFTIRSIVWDTEEKCIWIQCMKCFCSQPLLRQWPRRSRWRWCALWGYNSCPITIWLIMFNLVKTRLI